MNAALAGALALVAALFTSNVVGDAYGDGDLWWQRQLGEFVLRTQTLPHTLGPATFSAPDALWIPHEWVFATLWAVANRAGWTTAFCVGCAAIAVLTFVIEAARSQGAPIRARVIMLVFVASALAPYFGVRAQVLGWPLLALLLLVLEAGGKRVWYAVPIAIVWYNLHASALVVPCIVAVYGIGRLLDERRPADGITFGTVAIGCGLASLCTPFGSALPAFIIAWSANPATALIYEWMPAAPDKILILAGVWVAAVVLIAGECRGARLTWAQRLLALALFAATMVHIRNLGLFCIVTGPWTAHALGRLLPSLAGATPARRSPSADRNFMLAAGAAGVLFVMFRINLPAHSGPAPAVAHVTALHRPLRVACEDFSWCSRFAGDAGVRVLLDGRTDAYPAAVFADYRRLTQGDALPVVGHWNIDAVIVEPAGPLAKALRTGGWTVVPSGELQLFLRPRHPARRSRRDGDCPNDGVAAGAVRGRCLEDETLRFGHAGRNEGNGLLTGAQNPARVLNAGRIE